MCNLTAVKGLPPQDELWELFDYNPETGELSENERGHVYGTRPRKGRQSKYIRAYIDNTPYLAHRIIWTMVHGQIPDGMTIDHINCDGRDNRLSNLRLATISQQMQNRKEWSETGVKGVYINSSSGKPYKSCISVNKKMYYLGVFDTVEEAAAAYEQAAYKYQGQFARPTSVASAA